MQCQHINYPQSVDTTLTRALFSSNCLLLQGRVLE